MFDAVFAKNRWLFWLCGLIAVLGVGYHLIVRCCVPVSGDRLSARETVTVYTDSHMIVDDEGDVLRVVSDQWILRGVSAWWNSTDGSHIVLDTPACVLLALVRGVRPLFCGNLEWFVVNPHYAFVFYRESPEGTVPTHFVYRTLRLFR